MEVLSKIFKAAFQAACASFPAAGAAFGWIGVDSFTVTFALLCSTATGAAETKAPPLFSFWVSSASCFSRVWILSFRAAASVSPVRRQAFKAAFSSAILGEEADRRSPSTDMNSSSMFISLVWVMPSAWPMYSAASSFVKSSRFAKSSGQLFAISNARKCRLTSLAKTMGSFPERISSSISCINVEGSSSRSASAKWNRKDRSAVPSTLRTNSSVTSL